MSRAEITLRPACENFVCPFRLAASQLDGPGTRHLQLTQCNEMDMTAKSQLWFPISRPSLYLQFHQLRSQNSSK